MTYFTTRFWPGNARWLPAAAAIALASGCVTTDSGRFVDAPELASGDALQAELNTSSQTNLNNGSRFSAHWFCATAEVPRAFYGFQSPFPAELTLFNEQGWLVDKTQVEPGVTGPVDILMGPEAGQCSLLVVNGNDDKAYGPYRLTDHPISGESAELGTDQSLVGALNAGNNRVMYPLSVDNPTQISFTLSDASRSLGMLLTGPAVNATAIACGDSTLTLDAYLEPGIYELALLSGQRPAQQAAEPAFFETPLCTDALVSEGNFYRLDTASTVLPEGIRNGGALVSGETLSGLLLSTEGNAYGLELAQPAEVVVSMASEDFDTLLSITSDDVELENDDFGDGTNSQLSSILMPGSYTVTARSYEDFPVDGLYTLSTQVTPFSGDLRNSGNIAPGSSLIGMHTDNDNQYTLTIVETSEVTISLNSAGFDTILTLSGNGLDLSDDDGGGGTNSRISTMMQPGTYTLGVGSYSGSGLFDLSVSSSEVTGERMDSGELSAGDVVYGNLPSGGNLTYSISVDAARTVSIDAVSSAVDTIITLTGQSLTLEDDDGGEGTNSRLEEFLPAGNYTLTVRGYSNEESGQVRIEVQMDMSDAQS